MRLTLLGVGAMKSPRYAPAGVLIATRRHRVAIDGGGSKIPPGRLDGWLVSDERAELMSAIRARARPLGLVPEVAAFRGKDLEIEPHPVVHTNHPAFGYRIRAGRRVAVWAPEFWRFPSWAAGADLMLAEAAGWSRPIAFRSGKGGHAAALDVAREARRRRVKRLVFAHVGRPTIRALDAGGRPPFGQIGRDGQVFAL
jgi:hypothetical protein